MAQGFYEILGVDQSATGDAIHAAFHAQLAELVRRLRAARKQGADVTILEGQERALKEAMSVLTDPARRQRYDAYRKANLIGMPSSAESMWAMAKDALVDPLAIASLDVLRETTDLKIGNPFTVCPGIATRKYCGEYGPRDVIWSRFWPIKVIQIRLFCYKWLRPRMAAHGGTTAKQI